MDDFQNRQNGLIFGLATGDRIGGPSAMAMILAQSLIERHDFDPNDLIKRYVEWWQTAGFDTGPVATRVFREIARGSGHEEAVYQVHLSLGEQTAGCNPAHRIAPIAMAGIIDNNMLSNIAHREAALTHWDPLAGDVAASVAQVCRSLLIGKSWGETIKELLPTMTYLTIQQHPESLINRGGFAPDVFHTAIYFVDRYPSFETALIESIKFAGGANYCPVLVGAFAGARWGKTSIPNKMIEHHQSIDQIEQGS